MGEPQGASLAIARMVAVSHDHSAFASCRDSSARFLRKWSAPFSPPNIPKNRAVSEAVRNFRTPSPGTPIFPVPILGLVTGTEFEPREFFDNALPVALAVSLAAKPAIEEGLHADRENDARRLHAHREANWVELSDRLPRHDLVKVIKRHAEQAFELLTRPEGTPLRMRKAGARMGEPRELDEPAGDRIGDTRLALSFERRPCHRPRMWRQRIETQGLFLVRRSRVARA